MKIVYVDELPEGVAIEYTKEKVLFVGTGKENEADGKE